MHWSTRIGAAVIAVSLALAPGVSLAAGARGAHPAAAPKPIAVYVGSRLLASGQKLDAAVAKVRAQVPFAIKTPRYVPRGYTPVQLSVIPRQRDVSEGRSTLSYAATVRGKNPLVTASAGFVIDQANGPLPYVRGTRSLTVTVGSSKATLSEFKAGGHDLLILSGTTAQGGGYDVVTDAAVSHITPSTLTRIAASLR